MAYFNKFKTSIFFCLLLIVSALQEVNAQQNLSAPEIEKSYLHTDRDTYVIGEDLWYKAYVVYAYNHLLYNHSHILYVELISPDAKIISRNKTKLISSIGHGDFKLTDSTGIKPGNYQLRAYTNWTRNFGDRFVFKKEIKIIDVFEAQRKLNSNEAIPNNLNVTDDGKPNSATQNNMDIQFFPEGGSLLQGVASIVAFKAVDGQGNPIKVQGQILDENNNMVAMFISMHDGMGKFQIKPEAGKQYHAKISTANDIQTVPLPKVLDEGYLLSYKTIQNRAILSVKTNTETLLKNPKQELGLVYTVRGIMRQSDGLILSKNTVSFELPNNLPEGICQITLYDKQLKPHSERLVFVPQKNNLQLNLTTDKEIYAPNEKVTINISSKNHEGMAEAASYSLAVSDLNGAEPTTTQSNICSYFLMESDIKGTVNLPGYYFNTENPNRLKHLDLLLLTQGWRDFLWKQLPDLNSEATYKAEKGINISGKVKQLFGDKPVEGNSVSLAIFNKGIDIKKTTTNALGEFKFENLDITGSARIVLNTKNKKGKLSGMFVLDSIFRAPMKVGDITNKSFVQDVPELNLIAQNIYKKHIDFEVMPENVLDEVEINAKKEKETMSKSIYRNLGNQYIVDAEKNVFADIFQLLLAAVPQLEIQNDVIKFTRNSGGALIVVNDTRILDPSIDEGEATNIYNFLNTIMPDEVESISSSNGPVATMMFGNQGRNGVIVINTKPNVILAETQTRKSLSNIKKEIEGYYEARTFYVPKTNQENKTAIRNTLYWNPYVHPDKTGHSQVHYVNSAVETKVKITLEGITASGIPVVKHSYYSIEK